jgi:hypothetical protein
VEDFRAKLTMWEGVDFDGGTSFFIDTLQASQCIDAVNVHGTAATDALSTAPSEGQGGVEFVLDFDQRVQYHGPTFLQVYRVGLQAGLLARLVRVPAVDGKLLGFGR